MRSLEKFDTFFCFFDLLTSAGAVTGKRAFVRFEVSLLVSVLFSDAFLLGFLVASSAPSRSRTGALLAALSSASLRKSAARFRGLCLDLVAVCDPSVVIASAASTDAAEP